MPQKKCFVCFTTGRTSRRNRTARSPVSMRRWQTKWPQARPPQETVRREDQAPAGLPVGRHAGGFGSDRSGESVWRHLIVPGRLRLRPTQSSGGRLARRPGAIRSGRHRRVPTRIPTTAGRNPVDTMTDDQNQDLYEAMRSDFETGECALPDDSRSGPTVVRFCRDILGVIDSEAHRKKFRRFRTAPQGIFADTPAGAARNPDGDGPAPVLVGHLPRQ